MPWWTSGYPGPPGVQSDQWTAMSKVSVDRSLCTWYSNGACTTAAPAGPRTQRVASCASTGWSESRRRAQKVRREAELAVPVRGVHLHGARYAEVLREGEGTVERQLRQPKVIVRPRLHVPLRTDDVAGEVEKPDVGHAWRLRNSPGVGGALSPFPRGAVPTVPTGVTGSAPGRARWRFRWGDWGR